MGCDSERNLVRREVSLVCVYGDACALGFQKFFCSREVYKFISNIADMSAESSSGAAWTLAKRK